MDLKDILNRKIARHYFLARASRSFRYLSMKSKVNLAILSFLFGVRPPIGLIFTVLSLFTSRATLSPTLIWRSFNISLWVQARNATPSIFRPDSRGLGKNGEPYTPSCNVGPTRVHFHIPRAIFQDAPLSRD